VGRWQDENLVITDRKKDLIITSGGKNISPQNLENTIVRMISIVSNAMVFGDNRKYLTVLLTLDPERTLALAREKGFGFKDYPSLTQSPELRNYVQIQMDTVNDQLAPYETLKKFVILPREFSMEKGEVTPTLKLKRRVIRDKFGEQMDARYAADA
jgi:long-chain acyl-CoA synthetase